MAGAAAAPAAALIAGRAHGFGDASLFDIPLLEYDSPTWNPRPTAIRRLLLELEMSTSVLITDEPSSLRPTDEALFSRPVVMLAGDRGFEPWSDDAREAMNLFLSAGGLLIVDSSEGRSDGEFDTSVRREVSAFLPSTTLGRISSDHVVYKSFYLVDGAPGRVQVETFLEGAEYDERLAVIYSHNDLMGAWARDSYGNYEFEVHPGGERQRTMAYRLGVNIAMYALCLDYKEDQVHVPFIMRRRDWRVE